MELGDIKLREISLFVELMRIRSVRELARRHRIHPGQISKTIRTLEDKAGCTLFERSASGLEPTTRAAELLPEFQKLQAVYETLDGTIATASEQTVFTFGSTSFLSTRLMPLVLPRAQLNFVESRLRMIDLPPSQLIAAGIRGAFQACVHVGTLDWPKTWTSLPLGQVTSLLCVRKKHPLSSRPSLANLLKYPFIYPLYWSSEGLTSGNDRCPVPIHKRIRGFETSTADCAAELLMRSDQVAYIPDLAVAPWIARGDLRVIKMSAWKPSQQTVYLTVRSDGFRQKMFEWFAQELSLNIAKLKVAAGTSE